jgi:hypothetical protein
MQCFSPADANWLDRIEQACKSFAAECRAVATTANSTAQGTS